MFRKTQSNKQMNLFSSSENFLGNSAMKFFNDKKSWHNLFHKEVFSRIDESIFSVLYSSNKGAPNASIRVMVAMMIIKEGYGLSDSQLFEYCQFNMLFRSALGLFNYNDTIPAESTYYLFRRNIVEYEGAHGENLIEKAFASITKSQAYDFEVSGKRIRMDSKLLGSNIAWYSRYELVHESLSLFWKEQSESIRKDLDKETVEELNSILAEKGCKIVFRSSREEIKPKLEELGSIIFKILHLPSLLKSDAQNTLSLVFEQQFKVVEKVVSVRPKEEIKSDSIQSPHDTDAHYRDKDGNKVKGYNVNVTESCEEDGLNLISYVDVNPVSASDCNLLTKGIEKSQEVFQQITENVHADGAYHSPRNQDFCKKNGTNFIIPTIQGAKGRFDFNLLENDELQVTDTLTGTIHVASRVNCRGKYKLKWKIIVDKKYYYFIPKDIVTNKLRKSLGEIPKEVLDIRNNVEATIFQIGFHYSNDKTRYRGLSRTKMWANYRCLWINFIRIQNYLGQIFQRTTFLSNLATKISFEKQFLTLFFIFINFYSFSKTIYPNNGHYKL